MELETNNNKKLRLNRKMKIAEVKLK